MERKGRANFGGENEKWGGAGLKTKFAAAGAAHAKAEGQLLMYDTPFLRRFGRDQTWCNQREIQNHNPSFQSKKGAKTERMNWPLAPIYFGEGRG